MQEQSKEQICEDFKVSKPSKRSTLGSVEMLWRVKGLPHKREDLSLHPKNSCKGCVCGEHDSNSSVHTVTTGAFPEAHAGLAWCM